MGHLWLVRLVKLEQKKIRHPFVISISNGAGLLSHVVANVRCLISS